MAKTQKENETSKQSGKNKALELAISQIQKNFGSGAIMKLGDKPTKTEMDIISTGSLALDRALGVGGFPKGRIVEIFGPESSGKTTLAMHAVAECQKTGGTAAFIDAEHAFDPTYAEKIGLNVEDLLISQPTSGEEALQIAEMLIRSGAVDIVVIDSVAALVPAAEIKGEIGDSFVGLQARLMSQALRRLTGIISKSNSTALFINQIREKIGVMFGNPETTPGGRALKFYSSVRIDIRRKTTIKVGDSSIGNTVKAKVVKNKVAPPFKAAIFDILFGIGICPYSETIDLAVEHNIINKAGSWYSYKDNKLGQGKDNVSGYLKENDELYNEIRQEVVVKLKES
ncbi:MAG: recombinase RecA [Candidatus Muiribacterium halophilum]|uniref:Protein RecA n=1 Tax=Muiribacterium halophilum TaxID=2053465 RepID=A0A2N5ZAQ5_MUIH1|nr:MAG: recombinase RecA [Candidatus Muirbacterium halophilum]